MLVFSATLIVSAMSTLDSTLSSSAKLVAVDLRVVEPTRRNGRLTMVVFMLTGLFCVFFGTKDLFAAVAVSGTASMYLAPVIFFSLWLNWDKVPVWSYLFSFVLAVSGACLYFVESSGYTNLFEPLFGIHHKYAKLLLISMIVMIGGVLAFIAGQRQSERGPAVVEPA